MTSAEGSPLVVDATEILLVDAAGAAAQAAMSAYFAELDRRMPDGFDPGDAFDLAARDYNPPRGRFLVATTNTAPIGCGALQFLDDERAEVKRMWVTSALRGLGLGRRLLACLESAALDAGRTTVVLDTNAILAEAIELYRSAGYVEIAPYNENPYAQLWFEKHLDPKATTR